jgi:hypothetical protein
MAIGTRKDYTNERVTLGGSASGLRVVAFALGVFSLAAAVIWGLLLKGAPGDPPMDRFFHSYAWNYVYFLTFPIGGIFFVLIQHLVKAEWSTVVRRLAELLTTTFPLMAVLSLVILGPMLFGNQALYIWSNPEVMANDHLLHPKEPWLNVPFFVGRVIFYLAVFTGISRFFFKNSVKQDQTGDVNLTARMRACSGPCTILFAFMTALVAFDLIMSLEPHWFSTIFGVYYFAGSVIALYSTLIFGSVLLQRSGRLTESITVEHYHDLGKLLFAFTLFWAYISFSQFMLMWYANMPEETGWWEIRMNMSTDKGIGFGWVSFFLIVFHFMLPFVCLMSRWTKRLPLPIGKKKTPILVIFAVYMLAMHWVDLYWATMPSFARGQNTMPTVLFHPIDILNFLGIGGLFVGVLLSQAGKVNLLPVKDPSLESSRRFVNQ